MYTGHGSCTAVLASSFLFQIWLISMPQNPPKKMHRSRGKKKYIQRSGFTELLKFPPFFFH